MVTFRFVRIGLIVTGKGERQFLPQFFRALCKPGPELYQCHFEIIFKAEQLKPITSVKRRAEMVRGGQRLPSRDEEIGLHALGFLRQNQDGLVILIDDLEHDRREQSQAIYDRYSKALDILKELRSQAAVYFLVNMLEAYYFAHADAINAILGLALSDSADDVEQIRHPKNDLKRLSPGFDEIRDGAAIVRRLDLEHVLSNPEHCRALRALVGWCTEALGREATNRFRLLDGKRWTLERTAEI